MKTTVSIFVVAVLAILMAGCGGHGAGAAAAPPLQLNRFMVGYVWVKENSGAATGPDIMITGSTTAPTGYFKPDAGTITLHVDNGSLVGRASDDYIRDMTAGNDIIVDAGSVSPFIVTVTAAGLTYQSQAKTTFGNASASYSEDLSVGGASGTTLVMSSPGSPSYTPGQPASIKLTVNGAAPPTELISGGTYSMAVAFFDINGIAIPGLTPTVTSSDVTRVAVSGTYDLTPADASAMLAPADVTIRAALSTNAQLSGDFTANFNYGTISSVTVAPVGPTDLLWNTVGVPATVNLTATVKNQFNATMFNQAVTWANPKAPANVWATTTAGACFSAAAGNTDGAGQMLVTVSAPISVAGPLAGADKTPKGTNTITATSGSFNGQATINVTRPIGALVIAGPSRLDIGTTSAGGAFNVTGATDVDNDPIAAPGGVTWALVNVAGAGNVGNTGDATPQSTSASSINAGTGVVTAGGIAGQVTIQASAGIVLSNTLTVEVYGVPAKISYNPDTAATLIVGAAGEYAGNPGAPQAFTLSMIDGWGHALNLAEFTGFTTNGSTDSFSGANITAGGAGVVNYTVTFGSGDGTFSMNASGTWHGTAGGTPQAFSITRVTGLNVP